MIRAEALSILKLDNCKTALTAEIVHQAFRRAMIAHHPDTRASQIGLSEYRTLDVGVYQQARKLLLTTLSDDDSACNLCKGLGMVPHKFGNRACVACHGMGVRQ